LPSWPPVAARLWQVPPLQQPHQLWPRPGNRKRVHNPGERRFPRSSCGQRSNSYTAESWFFKHQELSPRGPDQVVPPAPYWTTGHRSPSTAWCQKSVKSTFPTGGHYGTTSFTRKPCRRGPVAPLRFRRPSYLGQHRRPYLAFCVTVSAPRGATPRIPRLRLRPPLCNSALHNPSRLSPSLVPCSLCWPGGGDPPESTLRSLLARGGNSGRHTCRFSTGPTRPGAGPVNDPRSP